MRIPKIAILAFGLVLAIVLAAPVFMTGHDPPQPVSARDANLVFDQAEHSVYECDYAGFTTIASINDEAQFGATATSVISTPAACDRHLATSLYSTRARYLAGNLVLGESNLDGSVPLMKRSSAASSLGKRSTHLGRPPAFNLLC